MELDEYMQARLIEAHERAVVRMSSPWLNRADAAEYARCSTSEIDRAADAGAFKRYKRALTPMFLKSEVDEAIKGGKWPGRAKPGESLNRESLQRKAA